MDVETWKANLAASREKASDEAKVIATGLLSQWGATRIPPRVRDGVAMLVQTINELTEDANSHPTTPE